MYYVQVTSDEYLDSVLAEIPGQTEKYNKPRAYIKKFFQRRKSVLLPQPLDSAKALK